MVVQKLVVGSLQTNCYLVYDPKTNNTLIIDPADDGDYIIRKIKDLELNPIMILVTHAHFDHVLAVAELKLAYQIPFLMHRADLSILRRVQRTTKYFIGSQADPPLMPDSFIENKELINFGMEQLKVITTPGHTPGGISFYGKKRVFSGDTIFSDGVGRTDFPYGSKVELRKSIFRLLKLPSDTIVYPGHGPSTTLGEFSKAQPVSW